MTTETNTEPKKDETENKDASTVELPRCDKCGNVPLKCKFPNDCGLESL